MSRPGPVRARTEYLLFRAVRGLGSLLPLQRRAILGGRLVRTVIASNKQLSERIENNLNLVMPDLDADARARIRRDMADNFGRTFIEILDNPHFHAGQNWLAPEPGEGVEAIRLAAGKGSGAVLVTGHFGQWEAGRAWMKSEGISCSGVYRAIDNPFINETYVRNLEFGGSPVFPKTGRGIRALVAHVARGGIVAVLTDQYQHRAGALDFLGHPAPTALLPAELALKFKIPLIPIYGIRQPDFSRVQVVVERPIPVGTPSEMMQAVNDSLAARIRSNPGQYYWLHRRWKKTFVTPGS